MTKKLTSEDITQVARDTADTVAAEFAEDLCGDQGDNGPVIDDAMLARIFGRAATVASEEFLFKTSQEDPKALKPRKVPDFEVD